jgi:16S rRNA (adenine1518-N6/adenine1519-N6)-dimethyltransferase
MRKKKILNELLSETIDICELYHIKPSKSKGQNFLINEEVYDRIVAEARIKATDTVVEVGPGLGYLTTKLAEKAKEIIAVEVDHHLAKILVNRFQVMELTKIKVVHGDILRWPKLAGLEVPASYKIVSNLPYNITSFFLRQFLSVHEHRPTTMTLMLQDEVAKRLCPKRGEMSLLGLSAHFYAEVEYLFKVPSQDFWPAPKVNSAVVRISLRSKPLLDVDDEKLFFRLARIGFSAKRKMLKKNIMSGLRIGLDEVMLAMQKSGIDPGLRPQDLGLEEWLKMFGNLKQFML